MKKSACHEIELFLSRNRIFQKNSVTKYRDKSVSRVFSRPKSNFSQKKWTGKLPPFLLFPNTPHRSVAAYNVSQVLNSLEGYPSNDYNVSIDSVYVKTSADVPLVWHDCEGRLEHGINSTTVTVTGSYPHAGANVSLQGLLPNGTLCIKASGTPYRVSLDVDVYLRFEPKSWAAPMTTTVLSDSFVTSFMANKEKMAWDIRGTFAIEEAAHDYAAVLRCTETGTVRFQLRLYYESWFVVRDHRGVMHSAQYFSGAQHVAKNVTCVQGSNLYVAGWWNPAYPQSSVSWEFTPTSSTPRTATPTPTPAPHKLDSDPTSTSTETSYVNCTVYFSPALTLE